MYEGGHSMKTLGAWVGEGASLTMACSSEALRRAISAFLVSRIHATKIRLRSAVSQRWGISIATTQGHKDELRQAICQATVCWMDEKEWPCE